MSLFQIWSDLFVKPIYIMINQKYDLPIKHKNNLINKPLTGSCSKIVMKIKELIYYDLIYLYK